MVEIVLFHSGNPAWRSCQAAIGVAKNVEEKFGEKVNLKIYTNDSAEALKYNLKSATSVFVNGELVPLETALSQEGMEEFIQKLVWE